MFYVRHFFSAHSQTFPLLTQISRILETCQPSSSIIERQFSQLSLTMTKSRNRTKDSNLYTLMRSQYAEQWQETLKWQEQKNKEK